MWIKLKNDGETIIGHNNDNNATGYDIKIPETRIVDSKGRYCFKLNGGNLVKLSKQEILDHPIHKKYKSKRRIRKLIQKINKLNELNNIKDHQDLTNSEKQDILQEINEVSSQSIDCPEEDL